jgi:hypothetical protein
MSRAARRDDRNLLTNQFGRECWKLIGLHNQTKRSTAISALFSLESGSRRTTSLRRSRRKEEAGANFAWGSHD